MIIIKTCGTKKNIQKPLNSVQFQTVNSYTARIRSPLINPACSAAPCSRTAETCWSGAYNSPLIDLNVPPSLTCPRTLNPKPAIYNEHIHNDIELKVSRSRNKIVKPELLPKNELRISALEVYYFKVNTKRESMFCLQEDRLSFVLTLK